MAKQVDSTLPAKVADAALPAIMDNDLLSMSDGTEKLGADARSFPFLKIAQDKTPQAVKPSAAAPNPSFIQGLEAGMLFNNISNKSYGTSVEVVPVFTYDMMTVWGADMGDFKGNKLPSEFDLEVKENKWFLTEKRRWTNAAGERAVQTRNFFCLIPDDPTAGLVLLSLQSIGLSQARKWLTNMDRVFLPPPAAPGTAAKKFLQVWRLSTVLDIRPAGNSFQLGTKQKSAVEFVRLISDEEIPLVKAALAAVQAIGNFQTVGLDTTDAPEHSGTSAVSEEDTDF